MPNYFRQFCKSSVSPFWRGHLFLFDKQNQTTWSPQQGSKLLIIVIFLEAFFRPILLFSSQWYSFQQNTCWSIAYMGIIIGALLILIKWYARIRLSLVGLYRWRYWTKAECLYFLQIIPVTIAIFSFFNFNQLQSLLKHNDWFKIVSLTLFPLLVWGLYQELLYRGILQTEMVRRWGTKKGILISNSIFTFGPLHIYHFLSARHHPAHLLIFVAIFAIGLFFSAVFRYSGNAWLVGLMHGLGDMFIVGFTKF